MSSIKRNPAFQSAQHSTYSGTQELLDTELSLTRYGNEIARKLFSKMNLENPVFTKRGKLLEFGAGTGFLAEIFRNRFCIVPDCVELDPKLVDLLRMKNFRCYRFLNEIPHRYSAIYSSNVLEHIEDDVAILEELFNALVPGGCIGIYVPAHPILYSMMDKEVGHVRRYTRGDLRKKVESAGFEIQSLAYDDFIGFFAAAVVKMIGYKNSANLGSKESLIFYDKIVYPISRILDFAGLRFILGKNLILVAVKPAK